jgi:hypothetical protein
LKGISFDKVIDKFTPPLHAKIGTKKVNKPFNRMISHAVKKMREKIIRMQVPKQDS